MAAPTFVDIETSGVNGGSATSAGFSWANVAGVQNDDYAIAYLYKESTSTVTAPSGWTELTGSPFVQDTGGFRFRLHVYSKRRTSSDTGTATWSWSGATWCYLEVLVFRGLITSELPLVTIVADEETSQTTSPVHPGLTVARTDSGLAFVVGNFSDVDNSSPPTGYTSAEKAASNARNIVSYYDLSTTTGATGTVSPTLSGTIDWPLTVLIEVATAAGGGITGTGAATIPVSTLSSSGSVVHNIGSGAATIPAPTLSSSGTSAVTGSGAATIPAPTLNGTGTSAPAGSGTGAVTIPAPTLVGSGTSAVTGSGDATIPAPALVGSGTSAVTGSGAVVIPVSTLDGSGISTAPGATGSGAVVIPVSTLIGTGSFTAFVVTGSGGVVIPGPKVFGAEMLVVGLATATVVLAHVATATVVITYDASAEVTTNPLLASVGSP